MITYNRFDCKGIFTWGVREWDLLLRKTSRIFATTEAPLTLLELERFNREVFLQSMRCDLTKPSSYNVHSFPFHEPHRTQILPIQPISTSRESFYLN